MPSLSPPSHLEVVAAEVDAADEGQDPGSRHGCAGGGRAGGPSGLTPRPALPCSGHTPFPTQLLPGADVQRREGFKVGVLLPSVGGRGRAAPRPYWLKQRRGLRGAPARAGTGGGGE